MSANLESLVRLIENKFGSDVKPVSMANMTKVEVKAQSLARVCRFLLSDPTCRFDFLESIIGSDRANSIQVIYILYSVALNHRIALSVDLPKTKLEVESVTQLWPGARLFELELRELLGVSLINLENDSARALLLPENWTGYPLRKDYKGGTSV